MIVSVNISLMFIKLEISSFVSTATLSSSLKKLSTPTKVQSIIIPVARIRGNTPNILSLINVTNVFKIKITIAPSHFLLKVTFSLTKLRSMAPHQSPANSVRKSSSPGLVSKLMKKLI